MSFGQFSVGISAGSNLSTMSVSLRDLSTFRIKPIFGYNAGITAEYKFSPAVSIVSGLSLSQKGFQQYIKYFIRPGLDSSAQMSVKLTYLDLPVLIKFNTAVNKVNLFYGFGPYISYGINGKIITEITGTNNVTINDRMKWNKSYDYLKSGLADRYGYANLKRFDFGIGTMLGLSYKNFMITASYKYGIQNVMWEYSMNEKMSNSCLSLSLGYIFNKPAPAVKV
jgi:hypothetical protein